MYVQPEYRGQGIGRALLDTVISRARTLSVRQVNLSVVYANKAAVRLYESSGFERYGLERDAFKIGDEFHDVAYLALQLRGIGE
jgi:ribosomal protein S18 acetylase RimI-like enzyme